MTMPLIALLFVFFQATTILAVPIIITAQNKTAASNSTSSEFAKLCVINTQARSITCTAKHNVDGTKTHDDRTVSFASVASSEFLTARRIVLNSFIEPLLSVAQINVIFPSSSGTHDDSNVNQTSDVTAAAEELSLSNNGIRKITAQVFLRFPHVKTLDLSQNALESIETGAFDSLHSLAILDLSANQLRAFYPASPLATLAGLVMLNLRDNKLAEIGADDYWLCHMSALQHLSVARNALNAIAVSNLTTTTLCNNATTQPSPQLTHLDLHGNMLYALDNNTFRRSPQIKLLFLDLSSTALSHVPYWLPETLRDLRLSNNNITAIGDDDFATTCCPNLNLLVVEHSNLSTISARALTRLVHLERAWLSNNRLRTVPNVPASLHGLFLDSNQIRQVNKIQSDNLTTKTNSLELQHLHLRNNRIARFEACVFCNTPKLTILDLSENEISRFGATQSGQEAALFSENITTKLELLNLSENFIGDSERLISGILPIASIAHVDFSFCTSLAQRRRQHIGDGTEILTPPIMPSESPEEEYKDAYDESNYISSRVNPNENKKTSTQLFEQLIFDKKVERIDLGYCAPLVNDLLDFIHQKISSDDDVKNRASSSSLLFSLNGFNFAAPNAVDRFQDLFALLNLPADVDVSDTEWNCSDARVRAIAERLSGTHTEEKQISSGSSKQHTSGKFIQASGSELTCLYPPSLNGLALIDERVVAYMATLKLQPQQKLLSNDNNKNLSANTNFFLSNYANNAAKNKNKKAFIDDNDGDGTDSASHRSSTSNSQWWWTGASALTSDVVDIHNNSNHTTNVTSSTCEQWQILLAKQYYKIDSLLRQFQMVMTKLHNSRGSEYVDHRYASAANQSDQQQWWPLSTQDNNNNTHTTTAVRQAAIFSALFVALIMLMCMCASLLIYCFYYKCLIWATSRRRRLAPRYAKHAESNGRATIQLSNDTNALGQSNTEVERVSSATSSSSVPSSTASGSSSSSNTSATTSSSGHSVAPKKSSAQRGNRNSDVVHYSRYHDQISTPSTVFSIFDAATEQQQHQAATKTTQTNDLGNNITALYDYPNSTQEYSGPAVSPYSATRATNAAVNDFRRPQQQQSRTAHGTAGVFQHTNSMIDGNMVLLDEVYNTANLQQNVTRPRPSQLVYEHF